jgi:regulatory protein
MKKQQTLDTYEAVKEKAFRLLEFRSHSEKELTDKLRFKGASDENIERTLQLCRRYGFVNDASYAERKANDLLHLKKYGIRRIRSELKMKGISDDIIEDVILNLDKEQENENLTNLVRKKLKGDFSDKNKDKALRYFVYRGYDIYDIKDIILTLENGE